MSEFHVGEEVGDYIIYSRRYTITEITTQAITMISTTGKKYIIKTESVDTFIRKL